MLKIVSFFALIGLSATDMPLPNWIDHTRERIVKEVIDIKAEVPPSGFRIPAEYEPVYAVIVAYTGYTSMVREIAKAVTNNAGVYVWVMSGPSSINGVPSEKYVNFSIPIDTVWMRDYGPFGISKERESLAIVDTVYRHYQYRPDDDAVPSRIANAKKLAVYPATIILDGGNFMVDSKGNLFMTERTYIWNKDKSRDEVNRILKDYFKVKNIYVFEYAGYPSEPKDGTGHIDMFMKLLNDDTVLIADCDSEPFKTSFNKAADFFKDRISPNGKPYKILRVKSYYRNGVYYTYTNSLIVNGNVLMPVYSSFTQANVEARSIYESVGLRVITINSDYSISAGGSIHCVTQTIPDIGIILMKEREGIVERIVSVGNNNLELFEKLLKINQYFNGY